MTEAGWTRNADVKESGFYWLVWAERLPQVVQVREASVHFTSGLTISLEEVNGQFLGPITPDSYQQGRVAGLREAHVFAMEAGAFYTAHRIGALIDKAQQAQDEKGVGDAEN